MDLSEIRQELDCLDSELCRLFARRMDLSALVAASKAETGRPIYDAAREAQKLESISEQLPPAYAQSGKELYQTLFRLSKQRQSELCRLRCGLLGRRLGHSYSPAIHAKFAPYRYTLFEKEPQELEEFLKSGSFDGLNVTMPYKKAVVPFCAELSEAARRTGSVNTLVRRSDGTLYGANTDVGGFACMLRMSGVPVAGKKALIFGSGGAACAVKEALRQMGAEPVIVVSRSGENNYGNLCRHRDADLLVNATPLGMSPELLSSPCSLESYVNLSAVFDVVYNPSKTALIQKAEQLGIPAFGGLSMLVAQAKLSSELFTGSSISDALISPILSEIERNSRNIVLIGMPGCGKSSLGKQLADRLNRPFFDSDQELEKQFAMPMSEYWRQHGEAAFRKAERDMLCKLCSRSGAVIATGGGSVTVPDALTLLRANSFVIWIKRELCKLPIQGRPLSQTVSAEELYRSRASLYASAADADVQNDGDLSQTLESILEVLP